MLLLFKYDFPQGWSGFIQSVPFLGQNSLFLIKTDLLRNPVFKSLSLGEKNKFLKQLLLNIHFTMIFIN
jgi:hypothetical protein